MLDLAAITTFAARLFTGGQNECLPRIAAPCAAPCVALCLAIFACAQPPPPQTTPTATPSPPSLAIPTPANQPTPAPVARTAPTPLTSPPADVAFTQITAGKHHACALRENGAILCWGSDEYDDGILDAPAETGFRRISAGLNSTCALRQDATIACWGSDSGGKSNPPQGAFSEIAVGRGHACALPMPQDSPPHLLCWGEPFPNGAETLPLDAPIFDIQSEGGSTCGLTPQADMVCVQMHSRATEITPDPFTRIGVGLQHVCALRDDGSAFCLGRNDERQATPPPTKFIQIAAGWFHSCGITQARNLECWGGGNAGGGGKALAGGAGEFVAVSSGWRNSCALSPNVRAACWNTSGYLRLPIPTEIVNIPDGVSIAFGGANFNFPVETFPWPSGGIAVVELDGVIAVHHDEPDALPPQTILDLTESVICCPSEIGMLSAALDPRFDDFPFLYVWYSALQDNILDEAAPSRVGRLARFRVELGAAVKSSELIILEVPLHSHNHLGGTIRFGADGMLYLGIGENGREDNVQVLNNLRGKIIRIDVRGATADQPYRIPLGNPFAHVPSARPEIWAYGMRNPWRMAFDPKNPANLFVADVGAYKWEEGSIATAGANLGWPLCEAAICQESLDAATAADLAPPAIAYGRDVGCAIIGGVTVPWLDDGFIFGDFCTRHVWLLERDGASAGTQDSTQDSAPDHADGWRMREIADLAEVAHNILAFGVGEDGSVYILSRDNPILRLSPE